MKKVAAILIVIGSGLAAFGFSGFEGSFSPQDDELRGIHGESGSVGWSPNNQIEITIGITLLVCGVMLHKDSK